MQKIPLNLNQDVGVNGIANYKAENEHLEFLSYRTISWNLGHSTRSRMNDCLDLYGDLYMALWPLRLS